MTDIDEKARSFLRLAQEEFTPGQAERVRVRAALATALGATVITATGNAAAASSAATGSAAAGGASAASGAAAGGAAVAAAGGGLGASMATVSLPTFFVVAVGITVGVGVGVLALPDPTDTTATPGGYPPSDLPMPGTSAPSSRANGYEQLPASNQESPPGPGKTGETATGELRAPAQQRGQPSSEQYPPRSTERLGLGPSKPTNPALPQQHERQPATGHEAPPNERPESFAISSRMRQGDPLLSGELHLLSQARHRLNQGDGPQTLQILAQLDEKYPTGMFIEERRATRVLALCMMGQASRGRTAMLRFSASYPQSVYTDRIRSSCTKE